MKSTLLLLNLLVVSLPLSPMEKKETVNTYYKMALNLIKNPHNRPINRLPWENNLERITVSLVGKIISLEIFTDAHNTIDSAYIITNYNARCMDIPIKPEDYTRLAHLVTASSPLSFMCAEDDQRTVFNPAEYDYFD